MCDTNDENVSHLFSIYDIVSVRDYKSTRDDAFQ